MNVAKGRIVSPAAKDGRPPESFDAWARVLRPPAATHTPAATHSAAEEVAAYRPTVRARMALVKVLDDIGEDGELVRMRGDRLVIGRSEGEIVIPHDISMSPRHAVIERVGNAGWRLSDLGSVGGTFVRAASARLRPGTVLQIGSTRLRFQTLDLTAGVFVEMHASGDGTRHECHAPTTTIGRAGTNAGIGLDDPFVSPVHATVLRSHHGWRIENAGMNGLWVRIEAAVAMTVPSQFLCGEQRFMFEPLH
jgi:pSer/pThr/pTyr-binding forkhead associated (FHA) protein